MALIEVLSFSLRKPEDNQSHRSMSTHRGGPCLQDLGEATVLVKPNDHITWRGDPIEDHLTAEHIVNVAVGAEFTDPDLAADDMSAKPSKAFTGLNTQDHKLQLEKMGEFQK